MINEAVILLGGMGTRMLPYTKTIPKEMLPIYDVPALFLLVKEAYEAGINKVIFVVTEHNKKIIYDFFHKDDYLDNFLKDKPDKKILLKEIDNVIEQMEFIFVNQNLKGTYGALYSAKDYIKGDSFIVMYGDDLILDEPNITKCLIKEYHKTNKMQMAAKKLSYEELPKVGVAKVDKRNYLLNLVSKKEDNSSLEIHGRMLLNKKIFSIKDSLKIHDNDEYYLPYALLKFKDEVMLYPYSNPYFNLGDKLGYIKASVYKALKSNDRDELLKYIKTIN